MPIWVKIVAGCLCFLSITVGLGLFMRDQEVQLGQLSMDVYDHALIGVSYARKVQTDFVRLAGGEKSAEAPFHSSAARADVSTLLGDLDVAIDRAITAKGGVRARRLRAEIAQLPRISSRPAALAEINSIDHALDKLVQKYTADGFIYRIRTERLIEHTDQSLEMAIGAAAVLAFLLSLVLGQAILPPLNRAVAIATAIANGRMDNEIDTRGRSETSRLLRALALMQHSIVEGEQRRAALQEAEAAKRAAEYESASASSASQAKS